MPKSFSFNEDAFNELRAGLEQLVDDYVCLSREGVVLHALYWQMLMLCLDSGMDVGDLRRGLEAATWAHERDDTTCQAGAES